MEIIKCGVVVVGGINSVSKVPLSMKLFKVWILLCCIPSMAGTASGRTGGKSGDGKTPQFDDVEITDVQATEGQTLLLPCTVRYLGDKVVSWIRSGDLHILTSGPHTFATDNRFEAVPSPAGDFWGLRIRGALLSDTGQYECQVNTDPKMSLAITLTVFGEDFEAANSKWVGRALIKGPSKVYVRDGSLVTFTCEISPLSVASAQSGPGVLLTGRPRVRWLHDDKEIFFEARDTRILVETHYGEVNWKLSSTLKIPNVARRDEGRYTCFQMSVQPDSVDLEISEGEHTEAMQRDYPIFSAGSHTVPHYFLSTFTLPILIKFKN